ncbi:hypothetical protein [Mesorhizobium sp. M7A.F.Ce.TU.012.03.2.1]|uniref:hypothetical protein n=1 Tax=Mesorhizobium sp. M7A.F.Ce.TU.012.03.2.1 TaxID=2493681 RepID=UPI000FDA7ECE|nr:hypothetical protein [Mesorhizobium sp. M7A.F.Ce.TU.012.03.2.1]AZV21493.1 hypothetical protein EJ079_21865 [Mesorhizobium sp. M7A.F.Ce.TU.012.03.2.1]
MSEPEQPPEKRKKPSHVGVPAIFKLQLACQQLNAAYESYGIYLVGSAIERPDWRDVDVVMIMSDEEFKREFPHATASTFEMDPKWLINSIAISDWLSRLTGLPIDFKIQAQEWANALHKGPRHALGMRVAREADE